MIYVLIIVTAIFFWLFCARFIVFAKKNKAINAFIEITKLLNSQYKSEQKIFDIAKKYLPNNLSAIEYSESLKSEVISLGTEVKNIDRRIALDTELRTKVEFIISELEKDSDAQKNTELLNLISEYENYNQKFEELKNKYNNAARKLKFAVEEKCPYTFLARLNKIKSTDFIK